MENHSGSHNVYGMYRLLRDVTLAFNSVNLLLWQYVTFKTSDDFLLLKYETNENCCYRSLLHPYCFMVKTWWRKKRILYNNLKLYYILNRDGKQWNLWHPNSEKENVKLHMLFHAEIWNCPYCSKSSLIQNIFFHEHFKLRIICVQNCHFCCL